MPHGHGHGQKPQPATAIAVANMTSVNGVLDVNKSTFSQPATFVAIRNKLGAFAYDPAALVFRIDQPTNPALPFPPSSFLTNLPAQTVNRSAIADDLRIVVPVDFHDVSEAAAYLTGAIFSAEISYLPDNVMDSDPSVAAPCYLIELT